MKFTPNPIVKLEWREGAILLLKRPSSSELSMQRSVYRTKGVDVNNTYLGSSIYMNLLVVGWEGIEEGDTGKPLPFNEANRTQIVDALMNDLNNSEELYQKMKAIIGGPEGN